MSSVKSMYTYLVYGLSILFFVSGIMGYLDIKNATYAGFDSNDFTVTKVEEGSPAEIAGMQVGDKIISVDSLNVRDTKAWSEKARRQVGETRNYVVDRNGTEVSFPVTFAAQPAKDSILNRLGWTIGLIFLLMAVYGFRSKSTWAAFLFAMFGLGFAGSFMGGPYLGTGMLNDIVEAIRLGFVLMSFAFLVDFLLHFPKKSSFVESSNSNKIIYGPALFLAIFFLVINILRVDATSGLNTFIRFAILIFVVVYFGWALLTMFRNYRKASNEEKSAGLSLMFWGAVIGLIPILVNFIVGNLMPTFELPGGDYMFLTMALIPICFALAINKSQDQSVNITNEDGS